MAPKHSRFQGESKHATVYLTETSETKEKTYTPLEN